MLDREIAEIGGAPVKAGKALVRVGEVIDASMTPQQKLGAGRRGVALPDETPFLKMMQDGLEVPKGPDGRAGSAVPRSANSAPRRNRSW